MIYINLSNMRFGLWLGVIVSAAIALFTFFPIGAILLGTSYAMRSCELMTADVLYLRGVRDGDSSICEARILCGVSEATITDACDRLSHRMTDGTHLDGGVCVSNSRPRQFVLPKVGDNVGGVHGLYSEAEIAARRSLGLTMLTVSFTILTFDVLCTLIFFTVSLFIQDAEVLEEDDNKVCSGANQPYTRL